MAVEIERKFKVLSIHPLHGITGTPIIQGYMYPAQGVVRVRLAGASAFLTIKGSGLLRRLEYEYPIPVNDAHELIKQFCGGCVLEKTRYEVPYKGHLFTVDVFHGANEGLIVAEVEMQTEREQILLPDWIGEEVTYDARYHNSNLVKHPYETWAHQGPARTPRPAP